VLVGAGVVHDQVHVQILRNRLLDLAQEAQELLVPAACGLHWVSASPAATSRAANKVVVPLRM
jgi:hypothetical protein